MKITRTSDSNFYIILYDTYIFLFMKGAAMKLGKNVLECAQVRNSIEEVVNHNAEYSAECFKEVVKESRKTNFRIFLLTACVGGLVYGLYKVSEKLDFLQEDYHNYVIDHAEYDPNREDLDDDPFDFEEDLD